MWGISPRLAAAQDIALPPLPPGANRVNRLKPYFCDSQPALADRRARASEVLEFCEVIIRIHREAGDRRESELEGLRDLEFWAQDMLRRPS
jgi:hypothetical protein